MNMCLQLSKSEESGFMRKPSSIGNEVVEAASSDFRGGIACFLFKVSNGAGNGVHELAFSTS